ncbi:helix-turn-helix domain-containing protein [Curtobacterium sp. MCBD17_026]|uniref:AraC family transcriptional regulator n=1 Tax=Curtobacterium sp. MCBD17_026 TaxID=2175621 RepID=UPI000DA7FFE7|nr:helix-turn-helix domain-containing protein [Curtobacterium sp. MCBD17_026]WIB72517.1 helix-turn-helix domain-containing protein [Curtobacterium sp. MCBD17_026]
MSIAPFATPSVSASHDVSAVRVEAAGISPDRAMADLPGLYAGRHWATRTTTAAYAYRYLAVGDSRLTLRRSRMRGHLRGDVPPGEDYVVVMLHAGTTSLDVAGLQTAVEPGMPTLILPTQSTEFEAEDYDQRLVHLERAFVHAVAAERYDTSRELDTIGRHAAVTPEALHQWRCTLETVSAVLGDGGVTSLLWHHAARAAATALLDLFPPEADPLPEALRYPRNARIRHAVEYLHEHAAEPVMIGDVAQATGLSVRSIQEAFQRHLAATPMAYLRDLRLDHVREELLQQTPETTAVSTIARRWGFAHLGRFAGEYVRKFGEYPKDTLRR